MGDCGCEVLERPEPRELSDPLGTAEGLRDGDEDEEEGIEGNEDLIFSPSKVSREVGVD